MFFVGFLPCDEGCIDVTTTGKLHSITSIVPAVFLPLAAMTSVTVITNQPNWGVRWGHMSFYLGLFAMSSGPVMFIPRMESYWVLSKDWESDCPSYGFSWCH